MLGGLQAVAPGWRSSGTVLLSYDSRTISSVRRTRVAVALM